MTGRDRSPVPSHLRRVAMSPLTRRNVLKSGVAIGAGALAASTPLQVTTLPRRTTALN